MVSSEREVSLNWRPFSLALKNDEVRDGHDHTEHGDLHRSAHRVLRVMLAAGTKGAKLIDLYNDFGLAHHIGGEAFDDALIVRTLGEHQLPAELAAAADSTDFDAALTDSIKSATDVAGQDIGVPTIIFIAQDGSKNGFFGPVLQTLPEKTQALKLWDGLTQLATDKNFYELKRSRPSGDPDVFSTARC